MIIVICSGCGAKLGTKDEGSDGTMISHGLCMDCVRTLYPQYADKIIRNMEQNKEGVDREMQSMLR